MTKAINSNALYLVNRALGISGRVEGATDLENDRVVQALGINELVRRARTIAGSEGIFLGLMENTHSAANTVATVVTPYDVPTGGIGAWPSPVPTSLDVWILGVSVQHTGGAGSLTGAFYIDMPTTQVGWGVDQAGAAVAALRSLQVVAYWDSLVTQTSAFARDSVSGRFYWPVNLRIGRQRDANDLTRVVFSSTSSAAAVFLATVILGLFPIGMDQDIAF